MLILRRGRHLRALSAFLLVVAGTVTIAAALYFGRPDGNALSKIIEDRCALHGQSADISEPCLKLDRDEGYALLRDRKGSHHYLLLPTRPILGIESAELLDPSTPNYFLLAWESRDLLSSSMYPVADTDVLLAVNSLYGRSQNRLHIHISCMAPELRARLDVLARDADDAWRSVPNGLLSRDYWIRRAGEEEIRSMTPFQLLASGFPAASDIMAKFSLAMTKAPGGGFLILATKLAPLDFNFASAEELQDHSCGRQPS